MDLKSLSSGTGVPTLDRKNVHGAEIRIPDDIDLQMKLSAQLDVQMSHVQGLVESLQQELDTINDMPAALLRKAFSGEL